MARFSGKQFKGAARAKKQERRIEAGKRQQKSAELKKQLEKALEQSAKGEVTSLGSFEKYAD